jgi:hypothetical protein
MTCMGSTGVHIKKKMVPRCKSINQPARGLFILLATKMFI